MGKNEITVQQTAVQAVADSVITEYMDTTGLTATLQPSEKSMFVNMCRMYGLNPFKREIYCTAYGQGQYRKCSIVTGFEVYLKRAERTGKLNGWSVTSTGSIKDGTLAATITIHRKDWGTPFSHTVLYTECVQTNKDGKPNAVWSKMPVYMTKKVAMGQGFRLCFSDELGGMPYTDDEMGTEIPQELPKSEPKTNDADALRQILDKHREILEKVPKGADTSPYSLAYEVYQAGSDSEVSEMLARIKDYLAKGGINV